MKRIPTLCSWNSGSAFSTKFNSLQIFSVRSAYNLALITYISILGIGTYVLLKKLQNINCPAFWISFFIFSGVVITQITHISVIATASLLPWVILASLSIVSNFSLFSLFFHLRFLSANFCRISTGNAYDTLACNCLHPLSKFFQRKYGRNFFRLFVAQTLSLIAASPQILPSIEYYRTLTSSSGFSLETATLFSFPIKHILTFILPFFFGNPRFGTYPHFQTFDGSIFWKILAQKYYPSSSLSIFIIICFIKTFHFQG